MGNARRAGLMLVMTAALSGSLHAQNRSPVFSFSAGAAPYDLSGTGTGFVTALRADQAVFRFVVFEIGAEYFTYRTASGTRARLLLPELSVQGMARVGRVAPYLGGGLGLAIVITGTGEDVFTLHGVAGVRYRLSSTTGLRAEVRLRSLDPFTGSMGAMTAGFAWSP